MNLRDHFVPNCTICKTNKHVLPHAADPWYWCGRCDHVFERTVPMSQAVELRELIKELSKIEKTVRLPSVSWGGVQETIKIVRRHMPSSSDPFKDKEEIDASDYIAERLRLWLDSWVVGPLGELIRKHQDKYLQVLGFELRVNYAEDHISVTIVDPVHKRCVAVAEASWFGEFWYLNRVRVPNQDEQRHGFGALVLRRLMHTLATGRHPGVGKGILAEPGGYGFPVDRQCRFYEALGFLPQEGEIGYPRRTGQEWFCAGVWPPESELRRPGAATPSKPLEKVPQRTQNELEFLCMVKQQPDKDEEVFYEWAESKGINTLELCRMLENLRKHKLITVTGDSHGFRGIRLTAAGLLVTKSLDEVPANG